MTPTKTIRQAVYTALSGNVGLTVVSVPQASLAEYVLIDAIRVFEDSAQSAFMYDCNITLEIVKKYAKTGNKSDTETIALAIDNIFRPTVTGFITITGWDVCGIWLDSSDEFVDTIQDKKVVRTALNYYMKLSKS